MKIKRGRKGIIHLPQILKMKDSYTATIKVDKSMKFIADEKDPGWSKLWGIAFGHIHWQNSIRIGIRVIKGRIVFGYYCYIGGISPQTNTAQKGSFNDLDILPGDVLELKLFFYEKTEITVRNLGNSKVGKALVPLPKGYKFPVTLCYPNIKDKASNDIQFNFLKNEEMKTKTKVMMYAAAALIIATLAAILNM
jgi:hypothetical protein